MIEKADLERDLIELFVSCNKLATKEMHCSNDTKVIAKVVNKNAVPTDLGASDVVKNTNNPKYTQTFTLLYYFERKQLIKFDVESIQEGKTILIGSAVFELGEIMGCKGFTLTKQLECVQNEKKIPTGMITVRGVQEAKSDELVTFQMIGINIKNIETFSKSDPFYRLYRKPHNGLPVLVYETEVVKNDLNPKFEPVTLKKGKICGNDETQDLLCEVWDWEKSGKHRIIGRAKFTFQDLLQNKTEHQFWLEGHIKPRGTVKFTIHKIEHCPTFLDYVKGGQKFKVMCAVDFTASNHLDNHPSLHQITPGSMNQYQQALFEVGSILLNYDSDRTVRMYGFGAKSQMHGGAVNHCFHLNFSPNPEVEGLDGVMKCYEHALKLMTMSGPTRFSEILEAANKYSSKSLDVYTILLIITDGEINDMEETINEIIKGSKLPLSIVIIGVGNDKFQHMRTLDCDNGTLKGSSGTAARDIVQFVAYKEFKGDSALLAQEVLAEIPFQFLEYKRSIGEEPKPPLESDESPIEFQ